MNAAPAHHHPILQCSPEKEADITIQRAAKLFSRRDALKFAAAGGTLLDEGGRLIDTVPSSGRAENTRGNVSFRDSGETAAQLALLRELQSGGVCRYIGVIHAQDQQSPHTWRTTSMRAVADKIAGSHHNYT